MAKIHYARVDEFWRKEQKYAYLEEKQHVGNVEWQELQPDEKGNWLTEGSPSEFENFLSLPTDKGQLQAVFEIISNGVQTNRDAWVYNFTQTALKENVLRIIDNYNEQVRRWHERTKGSGITIDDFVSARDSEIKWSSRLKERLAANVRASFDPANVRRALYRPFTSEYLYFDSTLIHRRGQFPQILPTLSTEENQLIWLKIGSDWPMFALATNRIPDQLPQGGSQCFPFCTYNEDGTNRRENITDWALEQFRSHYSDKSITKWDIFHYVYAVLHHPLYRERYAANLKRELPRIPFTPDFRAFADIGKRLAEIHVNYEQQPEYPLERIEKPGEQLDWRVERMKLSKDKRSLIYNGFLTLSGIPPEVFGYRLGNRSALDWIIDQYQVSTDKRSGITNDPNRVDDPQYIVRLVAQVITVSIETVRLVKLLADRALVEKLA